MATQSTTYRVGSSDGFSVFSLSNEEKSETSLSRISEDVQNPFKSLSLNQFSTTMPTAKPYSCKQCGQAFSRPHNLKSHLATHSSLRPYKVS
jgi:uncharacterized Zn-finger protein